MSIYEMKKPKRINAVSVSMFIVLLLLAYAIWAIVPIYWPIFQLHGIMRGACNEMYRVMDDRQIMKRLLVDARRTGLKLSEDNFRMTRVGWEPEELQEKAGNNQNLRRMLERRGKECVLLMHYEDDFHLPLIDQTVHWAFDREVRAPLELITWEKQCTCVSVPE